MISRPRHNTLGYLSARRTVVLVARLSFNPHSYERDFVPSLCVFVWVCARSAEEIAEGDG